MLSSFTVDSSNNQHRATDTARDTATAYFATRMVALRQYVLWSAEKANFDLIIKFYNKASTNPSAEVNYQEPVHMK
jgi:hypothetical protein